MAVWNSAFELTPTGSESPSLGDDRFRELKIGVRERIAKEHYSNLASGLVAEDGWHNSGSAKSYYQAAAPTTRPDGATALTAADNGRTWISSNDFRIRVYVHGTGWVLENDTIPVGVVVPFAGASTSIPTGWLLCDGQAVSRTDYASLFTLLGTTWGAGDTSTTFNVPDLREVTPVGVGLSARTEEVHDVYTLAQFKDSNMEDHFHRQSTLQRETGASSFPAGTSYYSDQTAANLVSGGITSVLLNTGLASGSVGTVTHGKLIGTNYIIKARNIDVNYSAETANIDTRLLAVEAAYATKSQRSDAAAKGYFAAVDCASGAQVTLPTGGTFEWFVTTYGATYNSVKMGISAGGLMTGTASANLTMYYKRLT